MKKHTPQKNLSVVIAIALMFSLMAIPSHAVVPGEDTYVAESTICRYDVDTGIITPVDISGIDTTPGQTTYSALNEAAREKINNMSMQVQNVTSDNRIEVDPAYDPYSGIVLIIHMWDEDDDGNADNYLMGTGYMVSQSVMVTALHNLHVFFNENLGDATPASIETRVYQGVSVDVAEDRQSLATWMEALETLDEEEITCYRIRTFEYDSNYFLNSDTQYDWAVATLRSEIDCYYYPVSDVAPDEHTSVTITGYPQGPFDLTEEERSKDPEEKTEEDLERERESMAYMFGMYQSTGSIRGIDNNGVVAHTITTTKGQSGSPLYWGPACTAFAIHSRDGSSYNYACDITPTILGIINQIIHEVDG